MRLFHVKPHGSLYGMAAKSPEVAKAVADAVKVFEVPVMGMVGTVHERVYPAAGLEFISEYYADLDYDDQGMVIINASTRRSIRNAQPSGVTRRKRRCCGVGQR